MNKTCTLLLIAVLMEIGCYVTKPAIINAQDLNIRHVSSTRLTGEHDVKVVDTLAFCAYKNAMDIFNISNPESPKYFCGCYTQDYVYGLDVSGRYAYMANASCGLKIVDITDPVNPTLAGKYDTPGGAMDVCYAKGYAFVADGSGLQIIDVSNPSAPTLAGSFDTQGSCREVCVVDDYAYMACKNGGLQIIDISNPAAPKLAGSHKTPRPAWRIFVSDGYAYVAVDKSGIQIIDISNPSKPSLAGSYDTPGSALGICVSNGFAYVADDTAGLQIIDVSYPSAPLRVGSYYTRGIARVVDVDNDYVYIANFNSMVILDVNQTRIDETYILPSEFALFQNYPNPFNEATTIGYRLPQKAHVRLEIFDALGRRVTTLVNTQEPPGNHQIIWRAENNSSGVYFYKLTAGNFKKTEKMVLLK